MVVDTTPFVRRVVTDIMDMKLEEALLLGSAYYRVLEGTIEELGDYGEEVYTHV